MAKIHELQRGKYKKSVKELYEDFQLENRVKNLSEMTIRFYEQNLIHYLRYLEEIGMRNVGEIEKRIVDRFILFLKKKELKATTINTYMRATPYLYCV
ncbi:site-specific integrase [Niallia circulans]|uniref:site-specific integrase n=1 Tax=Niallia circulans TaxID=1397 RepID=UPI003513E8F6